MNINSIREIAAKRLSPGHVHSGEVTPDEAWELLQVESRATMVDVRTEPEWMFVGLPDLSKVGRNVLRISWQIFPEMIVDKSFVDRVKANNCDLNDFIMFICRSGARSQAAAEACAEAGFKNTFNVIDGFEGDQDDKGHRGTLSGWKFSGLPWVQA